jgi:chemotaxis protein CheD
VTETRLHITQGEFAVGNNAALVISTLLGSCVSCCLWDAEAKVGGMNHMLLTRPKTGTTMYTLSGINAMELLINEVIKRGARRDRLCAKVFGGARMVSGLSDIGAENAEFTISYLATESIPLITQSVGGFQARNLRFWPATGRVQQKLTDARVRDVELQIPAMPGNAIELF